MVISWKSIHKINVQFVNLNITRKKNNDLILIDHKNLTVKCHLFQGYLFFAGIFNNYIRLWFIIDNLNFISKNEYNKHSNIKNIFILGWNLIYEKAFSRVEILKLPKPRSKNVSKLSDSFIFIWRNLDWFIIKIWMF